MTGAAFRIALAGVVTSVLAGAPQADAAPTHDAYVTVAVATVWTTPQSPRPIDHPALTNPVDIRGWLRSMTPAQQEALTSDNVTQTQALYGDRVIVVREQGDWDEVRLPDQPTPKDSQGYPGWIPRAQLATSADYGVHSNSVVARGGAVTWLYRDPRHVTRDLEISSNTELPVLSRTGKAVQVDTPDRGPRWLDAQTDAADLTHTAAAFLDVPYLWGGRSGFGLDCSGFTSTVYQLHGITLPRDAGPQAADGRARAVDKSALQPGDLLFYAHGKDPDTIYHVAMYYADGQMIEALQTGTPVRITPARLDGDYWGARRYLDQPR